MTSEPPLDGEAPSHGRPLPGQVLLVRLHGQVVRAHVPEYEWWMPRPTFPVRYRRGGQWVTEILLPREIETWV